MEFRFTSLRTQLQRRDEDVLGGKAEQHHKRISTLDKRGVQ